MLNPLHDQLVEMDFYFVCHGDVILIAPQHSLPPPPHMHTHTHTLTPSKNLYMVRMRLHVSVSSLRRSWSFTGNISCRWRDYRQVSSTLHMCVCVCVCVCGNSWRRQIHSPDTAEVQVSVGPSFFPTAEKICLSDGKGERIVITKIATSKLKHDLKSPSNTQS